MSASGFLETFSRFSWDKARETIYSQTRADVERALAAGNSRTLAHFAALLSPAASELQSEMLAESKARTLSRFGRTMQMYVPLYLTNLCHNVCTYCGFSMNNKIPRVVLSDAQIEKDAEIVKRMGFDHLLLVSGEAQTIGVEYFTNALTLLREKFSHISFEVQPLEEAEYRTLKQEGAHSVLVYQETYHQAEYRAHHPKGKKSNFEYRLDTPDRLGRAQIHTIGLGVLLGLEDWRVDSWFLALHLEYLRRKYWRTKFSISFPRLRPAEGVVEPKIEVTDDNLLQLISAFRLFDENIELSLSTRERPEFRDRLLHSGVTAMSAGSKTEPGGYAAPKAALEQFEISDDRSPAEVAQAIRAAGLEPVWKNWDPALALG